MKKDGVWKERVKNTNDKVIGRMFTVSPRDLERFFLRLLVLCTPGARSFADLRTVNNVTAQTFEKAALRGLIESNDQRIRCMEEAVQTEMPYAMSALFVTVLVYRKLLSIHARELWE